MKEKILDKIQQESDMLQSMREHRDVLRAEISKIQMQIERKNGAIIALKEVLDEIQIEENKRATFEKNLEESKDHLSDESSPEEPTSHE
jgi:hypothetical protein